MIEKIDFLSHLGPDLAKKILVFGSGGIDPRSGWIANLQGLARIGKRPACDLQHGLLLRGAPDISPIALRAIPFTVPVPFGWSVDCSNGCWSDTVEDFVKFVEKSFKIHQQSDPEAILERSWPILAPRGHQEPQK